METEFLTLMRAELDKAMAQLELRLVDRFASKKDHEADMREVHERLDNHSKALESLVSWRNRTLGAVMVFTFIMPVLATLSWHLWG